MPEPQTGPIGCSSTNLLKNIEVARRSGLARHPGAGVPRPVWRISDICDDPNGVLGFVEDGEVDRQVYHYMYGKNASGRKRGQAPLRRSQPH